MMFTDRAALSAARTLAAPIDVPPNARKLSSRPGSTPSGSAAAHARAINSSVGPDGATFDSAMSGGGVGKPFGRVFRYGSGGRRRPP